MNIPKKILLSDFFGLTVRSDLGTDHGLGVMVWMHPPVHRILGWISKPSFLNLSRNVWRLNQLKSITQDSLYVKGDPSISDLETLDRFPTLMNANLLNKDGDKIASIVDLVFNSKSGKILYYLVSRSNPKIPGSSRWSLKVEHIKDQQPGMVLSSLKSLNELPLIKASFKEEFLMKSKDWRNQIEKITYNASNKIEGWLEESPWDDSTSNYSNSKYSNNWIDEIDNSNSKNIRDEYETSRYEDNFYLNKKTTNDPWI